MNETKENVRYGKQIRYEAEKKRIARTAKTSEEYEERIMELARRLGI